LEGQLQAEVEELMRLAEEADNSSLLEGMDIPEELKRREDRLAKIAAAKAEIEARARERFEREQAEYEKKLNRRKESEKRTGKKPGSRSPKVPPAEPKPKGSNQPDGRRLAIFLVEKVGPPPQSLCLHSPSVTCRK
jgi:hypothetical protein